MAIFGANPSPGAVNYLARNFGAPAPRTIPTQLSYNAFNSQTSRFLNFRAQQPSVGANNIFRGPRIIPSLGARPR